MSVRFVNYGKSFKQLGREGKKELLRVLENGKLILQADGEKFEEALADFVGTKHAVAVNSGTDALYLILKALNIGPGDEVITCGHTFVATVQVINQVGATPILVDIDATGSMDTTNLQAFVTPRTKAIIAVQLTGDMCNMNNIMECAQTNGLRVIEDACQSIGAVYEGVNAGAWGDAAAFSFYPAKILGCYGDGGAVTTNNTELAEEIKELRNHYKKDYSKWAINSRLDNVQAAILNIKLRKLPSYLKKRKKIAKFYLRNLKKLPIGIPVDWDGRVWQDFVIRVKDRDGLFTFLKEKGIETMKNDYPFPIEKPPLSSWYESQSLRLPCNPEMTIRDAREVVEGIKAFYEPVFKA